MTAKPSGPFGTRLFKWWLRHPRLYRIVGFRFMCWRYPGMVIPTPHPPPAEAVALGRTLARKYGWASEQAIAAVEAEDEAAYRSQSENAGALPEQARGGRARAAVRGRTMTAREPWFDSPTLTERVAVIRALEPRVIPFGDYVELLIDLERLSERVARAEAALDPPSRCPRCEGYEATYHTFEGECAFTRSPPDEPAARRESSEAVANQHAAATGSVAPTASPDSPPGAGNSQKEPS